jgi:non-haem dioxygenase in morphine synthesis N-terminal
MTELPVISFTGAAESILARQFDQAFRETGFCYIRDMGVDQTLVDGVFEASRRFHALPRSAKDTIAMNHYHRGYMAPKTSVIETSTVARVTKPNDSESFMLMHEVPEDDPRFGRPLDGPNQWVALDFGRLSRPTTTRCTPSVCAFSVRLRLPWSRPRIGSCRIFSSPQPSCGCSIIRLRRPVQTMTRSALLRTPIMALSQCLRRMIVGGRRSDAATAPGCTRSRSTAHGW